MSRRSAAATLLALVVVFSFGLWWVSTDWPRYARKNNCTKVLEFHDTEEWACSRDGNTWMIWR